MEDVKLWFLQKIHDVFVQGEHNDIELQFQDGSMSASKTCVAALSPYFEAMLTSPMLEKKTCVMTLPTVSKSMFNDVLDFYFLGKHVVNDSNCLPMLDAAEMMQLDHLKAHCTEYMSTFRNLKTENCVERWRALRKVNMEEPARAVLEYIVQDLENLSEEGLILELDESEYVELLSRDDLKQKEDDIVKDIQAWIKKNNCSVETRINLFKQIRFEHVSFSYLLRDVYSSTIVRDNAAIQEIVRTGLERNVSFHTENQAFYDNRYLSKIEDVLFIVNDTDTFITAACFSDNTLYKSSKSCDNPGYSFAAAILGKDMYITGGRNQMKRTMIYHVWKRSWSRGPDLNNTRYGHCMAVLNGSVYVIGGGYCNLIEQLNPEDNNWRVIADLECTRQNACAESVGTNILVMGGQVNGGDTEVIHCFNTETLAVTSINIDVTSTHYWTRSYLHMPNIYLIHGDGNIAVIHVDDVDADSSKIPKLTCNRVGKCKTEKCFGLICKDNCIIYVSSEGFYKLNLKDGSEENIEFENAVPRGNVRWTLRMQVPRFCLL